MLKLTMPLRGQQEKPSLTTLPDYDPECYLCPGNKRAIGDTNPKYENTYVFENDYAAVKEVQADYEPQARNGMLPTCLLRVQKNREYGRFSHIE